MTRLLLVPALFFASLAAQAQVFVPKLGVTLNYNTQTTDGQHTTPVPGLMGGVGFNLRMSDHLAFQPELYFIQKNFNHHVEQVQTIPFEDYVTRGTYQNNYRLNYLELPLTLKYKFAHEKMFFVIGPYFAFALSGKHIYDSKVEYGNKPTEQRSGTDKIRFAKTTANSNNDVIIHRLEFGFQPGLGYVLPHNLQLEIRYNLGLLNSLDRASKNQTLMMTISYPLVKNRTEE